MADAITALQLIQRIVGKTGAAGRTKTIDEVSAGDPATPVTGVAVAAMASLSALQAAATANCNLVVTYDGAFWSGNGDLQGLIGNALYLEKRDFIRTHDMVVFNLHDHWRDRMPDGISSGMAKALGWAAEPNDGSLFQRQPTTLLALAQELSTALEDSTLRVVGDPKLPVARVAASFGNTPQMPGIALLNGPADVVICGYAHEWEVVEYCQDMISAGARKGLVLLGQAASVAAGMRYCSEWMKDFIPEVPVQFLPAVEPYWTPA